MSETTYEVRMDGTSLFSQRFAKLEGAQSYAAELAAEYPDRMEIYRVTRELVEVVRQPSDG